MKVKLATALSLVAVLGAGSAAALVNTEILDSGPSASTPSAVLALPESNDTGVVDQVNATLETMVSPTATPSATEAPATDSTTSTPRSALTTFDVGDAGSVTVDLENGKLTIVSASANNGWTVTKTEEDSGGAEIEVWLETATVRVEFEARLIDGQIVPSVDATALGTSPGAPATEPTPNGTPDDDDDHGEDDDDDHDEDDDDHDEDEDDDDDHDEDDDDD